MQQTQAHVVAMTSAPNADEATSLATRLIEERLAACVQILRIRSLYRWQGKLSDDQEQLLLIKTRADLLPALEATIQVHHSYELPELTVLPLFMGSAAYLQWIDQEVGSSPGTT